MPRFTFTGSLAAHCSAWVRRPVRLLGQGIFLHFMQSRAEVEVHGGQVPLIVDDLGIVRPAALWWDGQSPGGLRLGVSIHLKVKNTEIDVRFRQGIR